MDKLFDEKVFMSFKDIVNKMKKFIKSNELKIIVDDYEKKLIEVSEKFGTGDVIDLSTSVTGGGSSMIGKQKKAASGQAKGGNGGMAGGLKGATRGVKNLKVDDCGDAPKSRPKRSATIKANKIKMIIDDDEEDGDDDSDEDSIGLSSEDDLL
jgi:hypothetical protein